MSRQSGQTTHQTARLSPAQQYEENWVSEHVALSPGHVHVPQQGGLVRPHQLSREELKKSREAEHGEVSNALARMVSPEKHHERYRCHR
mmetsp:Transcript_21228/g.56688  ORF Transcript_21228/g.56688 Transcript_21228/m.56688 type:complete len:89 (+) Transcript_21228:1631-1897(+)